MHREKQGRDIFNLDHSFRGFLGSANFPILFGGKDPFDDPFFTQPFRDFGVQDPFNDPFKQTGSIFDSGPNNVWRIDTSKSGSTKGLIIEEVNSEDENELTENEEGKHSDEKHKIVSGEPFIEHPDNGDQEKKMVALNFKSDHNRAKEMRAQTKNFSVQTCKVTYGGVDGAYYTSTRTTSRSGDGVVLEESKEADRTTGQATHRISRGINDKGHSVTRKLNSDGQVDTVQTLHNLNEDDLGCFERSWAANGRGTLPSWNDDGVNQPYGGALDKVDYTLGSWRHPFTGDGRPRSGASSNSSKKVVRINID
ncbi:hypothetical protein SAY87_021099 [Trapa incisa]|uniref:Uncharacterized protein n=1 Tax=Trapa incisa TaxID=236973 RepID=A0AAN7JRA4_9MYRT|nr:hypothetical protein SAY87_021099 [Trapa incisa]